MTDLSPTPSQVPIAADSGVGAPQTLVSLAQSGSMAPSCSSPRCDCTSVAAAHAPDSHALIGTYCEGCAIVLESMGARIEALTSPPSMGETQHDGDSDSREKGDGDGA